MLRNIISRADEKMYKTKREKNRGIVSGRGIPDPQMRPAEYTVEELKEFLTEMSEKYALARVVDPIECRIIELKDDGRINMNESCYGIWNSEQKCINCSSALACRTGCHQEKTEHFKDNYYFVQWGCGHKVGPDIEKYQEVYDVLIRTTKESRGIIFPV
jgi:hypothetical protein